MDRSDLLDAISAKTPTEIIMLFLTEALWAHFGCTVAPDDSCAAPSHAVVPISSSLGRCSQILVGVDIVVGRRSSEGWQLDMKAKGGIRSLNAEDHDHACEDPEGLVTCISILTTKTVASTYHDPYIACLGPSYHFETWTPGEAPVRASRTFRS